MSTHSQRLIVFSCGFLFIFFTGCTFQIAGGYRFDFKGATAKKSEGEAIPDSIAIVRISNQFGDVIVQPVAEAGPGSWRWEATCWATQQSDAELFLNQLELEVSSDGTGQTWQVVLPDVSALLRGVESNLTLQISPEVQVVIENAHGNAKVSGLQGNTTIENAHGDIDVLDTSGVTIVKNRHGNTVANNLDHDAEFHIAHGNVVIDSALGSLTVNNRHGNIEITNVAGDLTTDNSHGETRLSVSSPVVRCTSAHGDIELTLSSDAFHEISAATAHGDIEVRLPESVQPQLEMTTSHGKTKSEFASTDDPTAPIVSLKNRHGDIHVLRD